MALEAPDKATGAAAVSATTDVAKKRDAAPSWGDLVSTFGESGAVRDGAGRITGYRYPRPKSEEERQSINAKVHEMWEPHRRVAIEQGARHSAATPVAKLLDRESGRVEIVPQHMAEKKARKARLVEAPYYGRRQKDFSVGHVLMRNGELQRYLGDNRWEIVQQQQEV